jgi:hypothetical protein
MIVRANRTRLSVSSTRRPTEAEPGTSTTVVTRKDRRAAGQGDKGDGRALVM